MPPFFVIVLVSFVRQRPDYGLPGERPIHLRRIFPQLLCGFASNRPAAGSHAA
jgi:hypothetical protein